MYDHERRQPVAVSTGPRLVGAVLPHPDLKHRVSTLEGTRKRVLNKPPVVSNNTLGEMQKFTKRWVRNNLTPLSSYSDTSVTNWLANTNYTQSRKAELLALAMEKQGRVVESDLIVNAFVKDEFYSENKYPRMINSRDDSYKVAVGPIFKLIEKELFALPWFIKKIPIDERPDYIYQRVYRSNATYIATDYTAYESHFTSEMMNAVEFELYRYMVECLPERAQFLEHISHLMGKNRISNDFFTTEVEATRMSGEMNTSLGNGFSNLMFFLFACEMVGATNPCGVVEGDDGLFVVEGPHPTAHTFKNMGLTIKLEECQSISTASFCGLIFDEVDKINISNPIEDLQTFGWSNKQYSVAGDRKLKQLLRSKSLSMLYQYRNAPIYQALARYGIRMTDGVRAISSSHYNVYDRDLVASSYCYYNKHKETAFKPVPLRTRLLMEREFGVSVESQLRIESYLDGLTTLKPLRLELAVLLAHSDSKDFDFGYVKTLAIKDVRTDRFICT